MAEVTPGQTTTVSEVDFVALPAGEKIGRYEVLAVLGHGSFGITYRAHDTRLDRDVAIKEYLPASFAAARPGLVVLPRSSAGGRGLSLGPRTVPAGGQELGTAGEGRRAS